MNTGRVRWRVLAAAPPLLFLGLFFLWPVTAIILRGLRPNGVWTLGAFSEVLLDSSMQRVLWFTLWQAFASTLICVVVGLPGAALFARYQFRGKRLLWSALLVPFVLPTVVVAVSMLGVFGSGGVSGIELDGTVWAILLAHTFFNYAVVVRTVGSTWSTIDPRLEESARVLGASPWRVFRGVTFPLIRASLAAASSIVFLFSFTSFGIVLILGGIQHRTLEVEIYDQTANLLQLDIAAVLAIVQLAVVSAVLIWFGRTQRRRAVIFEQRSGSEVEHLPSSNRQRAFIVSNLVFMALLLGVPLSVLAVRSFLTPAGWGVEFYTSLTDARSGSTSFVSPIEAIGNSLFFATGATAIALVLGLCAAWAIVGSNPVHSRSHSARWTDTAMMIPLGASAVTVGFGFLIVFDEPPLNLRTSSWLLPIAHAIVALPFVVRLLVPALRSIDPRLRDAASTLGASPRRVWLSVDMPIVGRAVAAAAGFAFAISLGEFGATAFLARPDRPTLPIAIYRALGRPGEVTFGQAMALSTLLMALTVVVMLVIDRFRPANVSEF
ncbi:MAG: iron ABC transporter permease [Acidimicrobiales bacterium]